MSSEEDAGARVAIGISFGNSYSSIACTIAGDAKVIANEEGDRQIPSILSYVEGEEFHGTQAKAQLVRNPQNTCAGFRDFLGKSFDAIDPTPSHASAHPLKHESTIAFSIADTDSSSSHPVTVSEITTRHIRRLASSASDYIGKKVTAIVIAVPTDFSASQKDALLASAKDAGLEVLQLVSEPTAALLASDRKLAQSEKPADKIAVLADLGGTRSDVAVISVRGGMYSILATEHDYALGGVQLDEVLIEHFAKEFLKKHKNASDPRKDARSLAKLRLEAEATKKALSLGSTANFNVESLSDGIDFSATINRSRYDLLAGKVFARFTRLVQDAVKKADLDVLDIDEVILAGGTAHTPRVASNIGAVFPESTKVVAPSTVTDAANPSELAARGAALQAYLIEGFEAEDIEQSTHPAVTVTPHLAQTIGVVVTSKEAGNAQTFKPIIPAETPLPVRRTITFLNAGEGEGLLLRLCEGVRDIKVTKPEPKAKANGKAIDEDDDEDDEDDSDDEPEEIREKAWKIGTTLGELALKDAKKGSKVTVQVSVAADMGVTVSAQEIGQGKTGVRGSIGGQGQMNGSAH